MIYEIKTNNFEVMYAENNVNSSVLWESHCHPQFELISVIQGDITINLEGKKYRLTEEQIAIIPPLLYHTITANENGNYKRVTALFDISFVPNVLRDHILTQEKSIKIFNSQYPKELKKICKQQNTHFYEPLANSILVQILYDSIQAKEKDRREETDELIQNVSLYIDEHMDKKISLDELAKFTSRSKSSFCHVFEEKMNISPKQYILQKKIAIANKMINDGIPPTVASKNIGYDNYSNFYRIYIKIFGTCPSKTK